MTLQIGHVEGGTHAGWRTVPPPPPRFWSHVCWASGYDGESRVERGYLVACPDCGTRRDDSLETTQP